MNPLPLFIARRAAWAPGLETDEAWQSWARGEKKIEPTAAAPRLEFLPVLFKRRLSQLSKMILEVGHRLAADGRKPPIVFASRFGEVNRQYAISRNLIDTGEVSPAVFSLSVFNTPVYLLSIAERNTAPGSAVYAGEHDLPAAVLDALGFMRSGTDGECLVVFGDELLPPAYGTLFPSPPEPYAFGLLLSARPLPGARAYTLTIAADAADRPAVHPAEHPLALLRWLLAAPSAPFVFSSPGLSFALEGAAP